MKRILYLIIILCWSMSSGYGQEIPPQEMSPIDRFFAFPDIAISRLTDAALVRSASVEALMLERSILKEDLQIARKDILNSIHVVSDYLYGNLGMLALTEGAQIGVGTGLASRYSAGVRISLPLDRLVSRNNRVNRVELQMKQAEFIQQNQEDEVRQLVINMYQEVVLSRRMLNVHTDGRESANISRQVAERQFREGQIPLSDLSIINDAYTRAHVEYETSYTNYETSLRLLEEVVGVRIAELMAP